jgi:hypothetical protein
MDSADRRISGDACVVHCVARTVGRNSDCRFQIDDLRSQCSKKETAGKIYNLKFPDLKGFPGPVE